MDDFNAGERSDFLEAWGDDDGPEAEDDAASAIRRRLADTAANDEDAALEALQRLHEGVEIVLDGEGLDGSDSDAMTLQQAQAFLKRIEELNRDIPKDSPLIRGQWSRQGGNYSLVGDVTPSMPPGYYDTIASQGTLYFVPVVGRTDNLLRFPHAQTDVVIEEIDRFWEREALFKKFRLPYKRGILMYGPPGSGKTSALQLIARDVVERGGIALMFDPELFSTAYRQLRKVQPDTPLVVLMEDLDALLKRTESQTLNLLDGAEAMHKVVFVATTNYPENLGPRVINRPSRFDKRIRVGHPDDVGRRMYLDSLIEGHTVDIDVDKYVRDTKGMSLAHLKELFVATVLIGSPYKDALEHLRTMHLEKATSEDDDKEFLSYHTGQGGFL